MIDRTSKLSVSRQAGVVGISRGSVQCQPRPVSDADRHLMHRIDKPHMEFPFAGARMLRDLLAQEGVKAGDPDETDGCRSAVSQAKRYEPGAGPQDPPLSAAKAGRHPAQPGLGDGHRLHSPSRQIAPQSPAHCLAGH